MNKFSSEITVLVCMTPFESYGSSLESGYDSYPNRSDPVSSLSSAMEDSHLIVASLYTSDPIELNILAPVNNLV